MITEDADEVASGCVNPTTCFLVTGCENWDRSTEFLNPCIDAVFTLLLYRFVGELLRSTVDISVSSIFETFCLFLMENL